MHIWPTEMSKMADFNHLPGEKKTKTKKQEFHNLCQIRDLLVKILIIF